jgi:hypothetical protein
VHYDAAVAAAAAAAAAAASALGLHSRVSNKGAVSAAAPAVQHTSGDITMTKVTMINRRPEKNETQLKRQGVLLQRYCKRDKDSVLHKKVLRATAP